MPIHIGTITAYSIPELERKLTVSKPTLRTYIKTGKLHAQKLGGRYVITEDNLKEFLNNKPKSKPKK